MSGLSADDHEIQWVASLPPGTNDRWWQGHESKLGHVASRMSSDGTRAWTLSGETGSSNGVLKGLSCMRGNSHVQFLGEDATVTSRPYPTSQHAARANSLRWLRL